MVKRILRRSGSLLLLLFVFSSIQAQNNNCSNLRLRYSLIYANSAARCGAPSAVTFRNRSYRSASTHAHYSWYINDSLIGQSKGLANIPFSYSDTGVYQLKIVGTDTVAQCSDSLETIFLVANKPQPSIQSSVDTVCAGSRVYFTHTTSDDWRYSNYTWRMPDNSYINDTAASFLFNTPGRQTVRFRVRNTSQCETWVTKRIQVTPSATTLRLNDLNGDPSTNPIWENCIQVAGTVDTFQLILTTPDSVFNYTIDYGDGNSFAGGTDTFLQGEAIYHTYQNLGTYTVIVRGEDRNGCEREVRGTVINERIPTAGIIGPPSGNQSGCAPLAVRFINNSYNISNSTTFTWTYGDGESDVLGSTNASDTIWHTYRKDAADCNLEVTLTAENACGTSIATWAYVNVFDEDDVSLSATNGYICSPDSTITLNVNIDRNCVGGQRFYYWDFGDGRNSGWTTSSAPRTVVYNTPGTYQAYIIDSNTCGSDTGIYTVTVRAPLVNGFTSGFTANPNSCAPVTLQVTDTSSGVAGSSVWNFGDGTSSTAANPTHVYNSAGVFPVSLTRGNECETVVARDTVRVYGKPDARIATIDSTCYPATISFINQTPHYSPDATFLWTLPDNSTSTQANPANMVLNSPGDYQVRLIVTDSCGADTVDQDFRVLDFPSANFTATNACEGNPISFGNTSSINANDGNISNYLWRFGDGNTSVGASPTHVFAGNGSYSVTLIATSSNGCTDSVTKSITVYDQPSISLTQGATTFCPGSPVDFRASLGITGASIDSILWDFADGVTSDDSVVTTHSFQNDGSFNVKFWTQSNQGCYNLDSITVVIKPNPIARVEIDTVCLGDSTTLWDRSNAISARQWDADLDGVFESVSQVVKWPYASSGINKASLRLVSTDGCITIDTLDAKVNARPTAWLDPQEDSLCNGDSVSVLNLSLGADSFFWTNTNGASDIAANNTNSVDYVFNTSGTFQIRLIARSNAGCEDTMEYNVVSIDRPQALYTYTDSVGCAPLALALMNQSQNADSYEWHVGSGLVSLNSVFPGASLSRSSDTVEVALVAHNVLRCHSDTFVKSFVTFKNPVAAFTLSDSSGCGPLSVSYTNTSTGASSYEWVFGNADSSVKKNPSSVFQASALQDSIYYPSLVATSKKGCRDTAQKRVDVFPKPNAGFTLDKTAGCGPLSVQFSNQSSPNDTGSIADMSFEWSFGNGIKATARDTTMTFAAGLTLDTTYTITLKAFSEHGCVRNTQQDVLVYPLPRVDFSTKDLEACHPLQGALSNISSPKDTGSIAIMNFMWTLPGGTSTARNQSVNFSNTGLSDSTYLVKLFGVSEHGCADSVSKQFTVHPNPTAALSVSDSLYCKKDPLSVQNNSVLADTSYFNYGDVIKSFKVVGTTAQAKSYKFPGYYDITLRAQTRFGCEDLDTVKVHILEWPEARFSSPDTVGCAPMSFTFKNQSRDADSFEWARGLAIIGKGLTVGSQSILLPKDSFRMQLVASNRAGCHNDTATKLYSTHENPVVAFRPDTTESCGDARIKFRNLSSSYKRVIWSFGDGTTSLKNNPWHNFKASSVQDSHFVVKLVASTKHFCADSISDTIVLHPIPNVQFSPDVDKGCGPLAVSLQNQSSPLDTGSIRSMRFQWDFGNGSTSSARNPAQSFSASSQTDSSYNVILIGYSEHNCVDSAQENVLVYPTPKVSFSATDTSSCHPLRVRITNTSNPKDTGSIAIMNFTWQSNGRSFTNRNIADSFANTGTSPLNYTVKLIGSSEHGCEDSSSLDFTVFPNPKAVLTMSNDSSCHSDSFTLVNASTISDSFIYSFGNGKTLSTNSGNSQKYAFKKAGKYSIQLTALNQYGCTDSAFTVHESIEWPKAFVTSNKTAACAPQQFTFSNNSINATSYQWWSNGTLLSSISALGARNLSLPGDSFLSNLVAHNDLFCHSDTATILVHTHLDPDAAFRMDTAQGCAPLKVSFTDESVRGSKLNWTFENAKSSASNPKHSFPASETVDTVHTVKLVVESLNGCLDSVSQQVRVFPKPKAQFSSNVTEGCGPLNVQFINQSYPNDTGSIRAMSFTWNLGNQVSTTKPQPSTIYQESGLQDTTYFIQLQAFSEHGCVDTAEQFVKVYPTPVVSFVANKLSGCHPLSIDFSNQSYPKDTGSIAIMKFNWTSNGTTSNLQNLSDLYNNSSASPKSFKIQLEGVSEHGCTAYDSLNIVVNPTPIASFQLSNDSACHSDSIHATNTSFATDSAIYRWGDGKSTYTHSGAIVGHAYALAGGNTIQMIALNQYQCSDTTQQASTIIQWPVAQVNANKQADCAPQQFSFTNNSTHASSYEWWSKGIQLSGTASLTPRVLNNALDTFEVSLIAHNPLFCHSDTASMVVYTHPDPIAGFEPDTNEGCGPLSINFQSTSTRAFSEKWNMEQSTYYGSSTTHQFQPSTIQDSIYTVQLVVQTDKGCLDSISKTIKIYPIPLASFTVDKLAGCGPMEVQMTNLSNPKDTSSMAHMSFEWDFGNGILSSDQDPKTTFSSSRTRDTFYSVWLRAYSEHGCVDSVRQAIQLYPNPTMSVFPSVKHGCGPLGVHFINLSTPNDVSSLFDMSFKWDYGNGDTSSGIAGKSTFQQPQFRDTVYNVQVIGFTEHHCTDTTIVPITVHPDPTANFKPNTYSGCSPLKLSFDNLSSPNDTGGLANMQFIWEFEQGIKGRSPMPSYTYNNFGNKDSSYVVKLVSISRWNCRDTITKKVTVHHLPRADFNTNEMFSCSPFKLETQNTSVFADHYEWTVSRQNMGSTFDLNTTLKSSTQKDSMFNVQLKAITSKGCSDSTTRNIRVFRQVKAKFQAGHRGCTPYDAEFTDQSKNALIHFWDLGDGSASNQHNPVHRYVQEGNYKVKLRVVDVTGCSDSTEMPNAVVLNKTPDARITLDTLVNELPNAEFNMQPTVWVSDGTVKYKWSTEGLNGSTTPQNTFVFNEKGPKDIWLRAETAYCEDSSKEVVDVILPIPTPGFTSDIREGCVTLEVTFTDTSSWAEEVEWFFGDGRSSKSRNPSHTYELPGTYKVSQKVTNERGQSFVTEEEYVEVFPLPFVDFDPSPKVVYLPDADVTFNNFSFNAVSYEWYFEDQFFSNDTTPSYRFYEEGEYDIKLIGYSDKGCSDTVVHENLVKVLARGEVYVPTGFTPDNDGANDGWRPVGFGIEAEGYYLQIFNRWGQRVFETTDREEDWDGTYNGVDCEMDVYVWVLKLEFAHGEIRYDEGNVTLVR